MRNNNQAIVRRITNRAMRSDKKRNFFIITAVTLTTLLLASVFSIGMSLVESVKINQVRFAGTIAHAAVGHPTPEQLEQLGELDYVKTVGTGNSVGFVENTPEMGKIRLTLHYFDKTEWEELRSPANMNIEGNYPQKENEIMVSRWLLEKLGIEHPFAGMEIPLTYYTEGGKNENPTTENFRLSGWFTNYLSVKSLGTSDVIFVSQALSQKHGKTVENDGSATVLFDNPSRVLEYCDRLISDLGLSENQPVIPAQLYESDSGTAAGIVALSVITAFFILTGYLLIFNVLYISVSRDVRFYGLLKTLGTTPKQIKKIVVGQIMRLCMTGIPAGLILSTLLSFIFMPLIISKWGAVSTEPVVSFSPVIYLGAAVFAMLTAILGAMNPAKKAAGISPVEAQKYTGLEIKTKTVHSSAHGKPYKMAIRNIFRDKKRAGLVFSGLFLGLTTFITVTVLVSSINMESYVDSMYESDLSVINHNRTEQKFDDNYIELLKSLPGFERLSVTTFSRMILDYSPEEYGEYLADFQEREKTFFSGEFSAEDFRGFVLGVDGEVLIKLNKNLEKPVDIEAFERGETVLIATDNSELFANVRELSFLPRNINGASGGEKVTLPFGGFVPFNFKEVGSGLAPTLIVSNALMNKLFAEPTIISVNIDVSDGYDEFALSGIKQIISNDGDISYISKIEAAETLNNAKTVMFVLGCGISLVIAFIGILNFVNVMSVGVMMRKRELATLESIGMSRKQIRMLLVSEGIGYAAITLILVLSIGNLLTYGIFKLLQQQANYVIFTYPFIIVAITVVIIIVVCFITPEMIYRSVSKSTVVERLREAE